MARILVIDDEQMVRRLLRRTLENAGHETMDVESGREAIDLLRLQPVDLVITDMLMPEMDGFELMRTLAREHPGIRVLAISGGGRAGSDAYLPAARVLGAFRTLSKPFGADELLREIEATLREAA